MAFRSKSPGRPQKPAATPLAQTNVKCEWQSDGTLLWTHTPPPKVDVDANRAVWRPIWCAGYETETDPATGRTRKLFHHIECIPCHCPPGVHMQAAWSTAFESALIGGRGSGKTEDLLYFLMKGWPNADAKLASTYTYLNSPNYSFLVLRKNAKDLADFRERARKFFGYLGGDLTETGVKFQSGAWGIFDHLADENAWEKYQGQEFVRIAIEEANQIPEELSYMKVAGSCRSIKDPSLHPQIMLTANPGGPGHRWFAARFLKNKQADGTPCGSNVVYHDPYIDHPERRTRVYIHSTVDDNPLALAAGYDQQLEMFKERQTTLWKRWRLGDLTAVEGQYFETFRDKPRLGEPTNACHVIKPVSLAPYWPKAIGCDWGYAHSTGVVWGCWHPSKQLHIYREMLVRQTSTVELGTLIAQKCLPELESDPAHHFTMYLSHDAFWRTNDIYTEADQIAEGFNMVLGKNAAFVLSPTQEESILSDEAAWSSVAKRQREVLNRTHITIVNAGTNRKAGWNRIRDWMRWWPTVDFNNSFNEDVARRILSTEGTLAWANYKQNCEKHLAEVLPVLQIHDSCTKLIEAIPGAMEKEGDTEDVEKETTASDDLLDSFRHLATHFTYRDAVVPRDVVVTEKLAALRASLPGLSTGSLIMAARTMEQGYDRERKQQTGFNLPRMVARRRLFEQQVHGGWRPEQRLQ